ncbi:MAG: hypothetical protein J4432_03370 [DPANN group archaeon]|nr:hypothetical protein [DPANN group archaeon]
MTKLAQIKQELDVIQDVRDKLIKDSREIIPACAKAIREFQKGKTAEAKAQLQTIDGKIRKLEASHKEHPELVAQMLGAAYQEYAELAILISFYESRKLPNLNVPSEAYLTGMGDAIGELKRVAMDMLGRAEIKDAEQLYNDLEDLYAEYSQLVYPGSIVPGLKPKQDMARKTLNNLHDLIISSKLK